MKTARRRPGKTPKVAVAAAALFPLSLAACGGAGASGSESPNTLTVQDYYEAVHDPIYQACAKKAGVQVKINHIPNAGLIQKVLQQSSSRTLPDVLMLDNPDVQQIAASGALSPLSDYGLNGDGMVPAVVKAGTHEGKLYGLAPAVNTLTIFYNKDLFEAAGITAPPKTWDELRATAKKLTQQGRYGFAMSNINTYEGSWQFLPFMWSNGGSEQNLATPETAQALQFVLDLQNDGSISKSSVNWSQDDVINQFVAGKAAMVVNGPWQFPTLGKHKDLNWAAFPVPTRTAGQTPVAPLGGELYTVPRTRDKAKMAKAGEFVKCLTSQEQQLETAKIQQNVPSDMAAAATFAQTKPEIAPFATAVKTARARTELLGADWPKAATKIYTAVQAALTGKSDPAQALQQAQSSQ
ncbi:extracellular solute-binding protein [Nonomuraea purpurea]|uniref:Extracellular solute-binding protein n=1 Tax=Nonomuraea purpurea TaxID=1849276 RepID=A0ABV8GJG2_9ACTN